MTTLKQRFLNAVTVIENQGWFGKGPGSTPAGVGEPQCVQTALCQAGEPFAASSAAERVLRKAIGLPDVEPTHQDVHDIWNWNDHPTRTKDEALAVLRRAAELAG